MFYQYYSKMTTGLKVIDCDYLSIISRLSKFSTVNVQLASGHISARFGVWVVQSATL